jgi:UrcA family protein
MSSFITKTANIALYAVAALPFIALGVARAEPATVKISDLNMSQPAHVAQFNGRLDRATDKVCADYAAPRNLTPAAACASAVRSEAMDKLNQAQRQNVTVASR